MVCFVGFISVNGECLTNQITCLKQPKLEQTTVRSLKKKTAQLSVNHFFILGKG